MLAGGPSAKLVQLQDAGRGSNPEIGQADKVRFALALNRTYSNKWRWFGTAGTSRGLAKCRCCKSVDVHVSVPTCHNKGQLQMRRGLNDVTAC